MAPRYDVVIVGAGHNGLVTAGYLARAGLKVLVLERRHVVGGACVTEEIFPGFNISTAAYVCSLLHPKVLSDLELPRFGYRIFPKDPASFTPLPDGRHLFLWQDGQKNREEIAKFSARDAQHYPAYEDFLGRLAAFAEQTFTMTPPDPIPRSLQDWRTLLRLLGSVVRLGRRDLLAGAKMMFQSVRDFLDERFDSDVLKATLATDGVIGINGAPSTPGTAYVLLHHCMGKVGGKRGLWGFVKGGMGGVTRALQQSAEAHGCTTRTSSPVAQIRVRNGQTTGVVLDSGEEIDAAIVVSNADPKQTFLTLTDPKELPEDFRKGIERFRMEGCSLKINLALAELPRFNCYPGGDLGPQHKGTIHICPSLEYMEKAWRDTLQGIPSREPMLECCIPTAYDPSLAPPGKHIMSIFVQYAPYKLANASWDEIRDAYADRVIEALSEYAPNIKGAVLARQILTPLDLEREFGLTHGNIFHGDLSLDQLFFLRPLPGWAQYRTPIRNLYLCGSGTHPGGGVTGVPGHNAAREILKDWRKMK